ncbi:RNA-guided endonuclease IscB [Streptomyces sp. NBC_00481]|uniref:RNA-guided endonuclease IscB n=1 Tax=unclassified Streptomyces TaxID=2593676 RepID=UPI002DDAF2F6|nr:MULTISPECIES: RNA-guided endonuclease IscB [unclassified Streptomyces]WRY95774.1 RNA-guided endonuclease IscB [Streptomyces sp. NBC_00481]
MEHGRGETAGTSPSSLRRHDPTASASGAVTAAGDGSIYPGKNDTTGQRAGAQLVPVLDKRGRPLMPCHPARAREMLRKGRAVVARYTPFTIRIKDRLLDDSEVEGVAIRIDPGSKGTGLAITADSPALDRATGGFSTVRRGLYAVELQHRGATIRKAMEQRANYRRRRRTANLRHRAPRFDNRIRPVGWLAPSLRHRVDSTVGQVTRLMRLFPIKEVHVESVAFDTHALSLGVKALEGAEYQQGTLAGYEVRQYLLEKWGRTCAYCGAANTPLQIEHIQPRARGGSDRISNLTLACGPCNRAKAAQPLKEFLAKKPARLAKLLEQAKAPLRDAAVMNATRWQLVCELRSLGMPLCTWSGGRTKYNRVTQHLAKTHTLDALAVGEIDGTTRIVRHPDTVLVVKVTGRGSYSRTRTDKHGFPRLRLPRKKHHYGFATGDLVGAYILTGKYAGVHIGRVAVRATGRHRVSVPGGYADTSHANLRLLQRADGYGYTTRREEMRPGSEQF